MTRLQMVSPIRAPMFISWGAVNKPAWGIFLRLGPNRRQIVERIADRLALVGQLSRIAFALETGPILERYFEPIWKGKHVQRHQQSVDFGIDKFVIDKLAMGSFTFIYHRNEILTK